MSKMSKISAIYCELIDLLLLNHPAVVAKYLSNMFITWQQGMPVLDVTMSIGPSLCSEWSVSVAGMECWFS